MNPTQTLLCPLGSFCFALAMAGGTDLFTAAPGRDHTTMSNLELTSAEVDTDELWAEEEIADRLVTGTSLAGIHFQEELNSSPSESSWSPEVHEERSLSADANSPLVTSVLVTGTGESDTVGAFASLPQAWVSPSTETRLSVRGQEHAVPATSPTSAMFVSASFAAASSHGATLGSDPSDQRDGLDAQEPRTDLPAEFNTSDSHTSSYSSPQPPQLLPANTAVTGAVATTTTGRDVVSPRGLPVTDGKEMGFSVTDPEGSYSLEATSNIEEPGSSTPISNGAKPTTAREEPQSTTQVICRDWSKLAGKSYVILNMTENIDCEVFRSRKGSELLGLVAGSFSRKLSTPTDSWLISLSKPSEDDKHLLMMLASDRGTMPAKEVLAMLGDVKENLEEIGIHNVTSATGCQGRPSQPRGDYGKLFIVLVIIGSICAVIIVSGLVYICWQRQLPKLKNMSRGEELHFVENGCHDNPTLDITIDSTSEMQEKKPSVNGDAMECSGGWKALITKGSKGQEPDSFEEDTHL